MYKKTPCLHTRTWCWANEWRSSSKGSHLHPCLLRYHHFIWFWITRRLPPPSPELQAPFLTMHNRVAHWSACH